MAQHAPRGPVPPVDSPDNIDGSDVLGNKNDTEAGDSLTARTKPPLVDSANNDWISDVVGNKNDTLAGSSLVALNKAQLVCLVLPPQDDAGNLTPAYVIGNKTDTVAGTSLVALNKQILAALGIVDGFHDVPAIDSAINTQMRDVIGNKSDTHSGSSIYAIVDLLNDHMHAEQRVLPDRAGYVTATANAGAWGAYGAESASLGTPAGEFDVHWVEIVANANDDYQARLSVDGVPQCYFTFRRIAAADRSFSKRIQMSNTDPGPITIALSTAGVGASTADFKVEYHLY